MNPNSKLDPELMPALEILATALGGGFDLENDLEATRNILSSMNEQLLATFSLPETLIREDIHFTSKDGHALNLRVIRPKQSAQPQPIIYFIHGGGYVMGSALQGDMSIYNFAEELGCFTASIEYRLAPETPYPGPLMDCYEGLQYLVTHAKELNLDPAHIILYGVSAGGGLAAGLALYLRDKTAIKPKGQVLVFPMLDDTNLQQAGAGVEDTMIWTRANNLQGWSAYLGGAFGRDGVDIYAAPSRAQDLSNLPPAHIPVGTLDLFLEENEAYATRLEAAGVRCELEIYQGAFHGFNDFVPDAGVSKECNQKIDGFIKSHLSNLSN